MPFPGHALPRSRSAGNRPSPLQRERCRHGRFDSGVTLIGARDRPSVMRRRYARKAGPGKDALWPAESVQSITLLRPRHLCSSSDRCACLTPCSMFSKPSASVQNDLQQGVRLGSRPSKPWLGVRPQERLKSTGPSLRLRPSKGTSSFLTCSRRWEAPSNPIPPNLGSASGSTLSDPGSPTRLMHLPQAFTWKPPARNVHRCGRTTSRGPSSTRLQARTHPRARL